VTRRIVLYVAFALSGAAALLYETAWTQRLLAHVPLLLHPSPRRAGVIGLGSGVTLASALRHPIDHADVLEISARRAAR